MNKALTEMQLRARIRAQERKYWRADQDKRAAQQEIEKLLKLIDELTAKPSV